jgi:VanZ family protein
MAFIFAGSTKILSAQHTSRFIGPFLHWLVPSISDAQVRGVQYLIRKCGHVSEYAVLSVLLWNARRSGRVRRSFGQCARFAVLVSALYAATDEFHQSFEPSREASVIDVLIDTTGAVAGISVVWFVGRWRKAW